MTYLAAAAISPLLLIPGFHIWKVHFDAMHCIDLGVYQVLVPSAMKVLVRQRAWLGGILTHRYEGAYVAYKKWCKDNTIRSVIRRQFKQSVWEKHRYPRISQVTANAASIRSMVYWLETVCKLAVHTATDQGRVMAGMFTRFVRFDLLC